MPHTATLKLAARDIEAARAVAQALAVELRDGPEGVRATLRADGPAVVVELRAEDLSGLRAAITGITRLGSAALGALA
ncbi:MAG: KEOPS complex subunit Pcc1 [Candidatus Thermoplasmatota archaeon]